MVAMGFAPSNLMMKLSFWLTARTLASGVKIALSTLDMNPGRLAPAASKQSEKLDPNQMFWSGAVAKVPPPVGSVKYKAQPIVLSVQILLLTGCYSVIFRNSDLKWYLGVHFVEGIAVTVIDCME
jgi:hypothetical protein